MESTGPADAAPYRVGHGASLLAHIVDNVMLNGEVIRLDGAVRMGLR